jgi:UDP-4-amino-4,6-dideoxy-N-acetyl-beta-L-altrosamine transaminase
MIPIPYGKQFISDKDIAAVTETLLSDYLTQGPKIEEFEKAFSEYIGCNYSIAVSNGTAALHLCALALDVQPGDKVITTPITFAASANCIRYCEGEVVFADIDRETYLIDFEKINELLNNSPKGSYKGIVPVDFAGRAVDLEALRKIADEHGMWIIEDACHAPGGFFKDSAGRRQSCGNGKYADLSIFSFHPVKHIATGEGGMITTNNKELYEKLLMLRTHGITRRKELFQNDIAFAQVSGEAADDNYPGWYMEMQTLGYNYRLSDIQAALGVSQLERAEEGLEKRKQIAQKYELSFAGKPFIKKQVGYVEGHAYHLYIIEVDNRLELYNYLRSKSIFAQVHYIPTHFMPYYQSLGCQKGDYPKSESYYSSCLSLPMYPTLTAEEQDYVIATVLDFYQAS